MFLSPISKQKPPFVLEKCPKSVSEWLNDIYLDGAFLQLIFNMSIFMVATSMVPTICSSGIIKKNLRINNYPITLWFSFSMSDDFFWPSPPVMQVTFREKGWTSLKSYDIQNKEVQIVYRLFLVNCYLLHVSRLPSQPASNMGGWLIDWLAWTGLIVNSDD